MRRTDPAHPIWTRDDLLASAAAAGLPATPRLLRNWEEEGLVDRALVKGRGPTLGVEGRWSEHQRRLFLELLRLAQRQDRRRNAPLANVPVWLWLAYGDAYVPVRQVRRALKTWAVPARHPAGSSAAATARSVVERLADPTATRSARRRFRDVLARGQAGEDVGHAELLAAAAPAIDPGRTGPRGVPGVQLSAEIYGNYVESILAGTDAVIADRGGEVVPDFVLLRARQVYRTSREDYETLRAAFAGDPDLGHLHQDGSIEAIVQAACHDLLLCVGAILTGTNWRRKRPRR